MKTIKGPAMILAQFAGDDAPFNSLDSIAKWAVPEWECCLKHPQDSARGGAEFIERQSIRVPCALLRRHHCRVTPAAAFRSSTTLVHLSADATESRPRSA